MRFITLILGSAMAITALSVMSAQAATIDPAMLDAASLDLLV